MRRFFSTVGIAACGLITSILTAVGIVAIDNLTGFDLFTLSIWVVVPVGAVLTGAAAASGYYFGSLYFHQRANWLLFLQMIVIAGLTQLLIYYIQYTTLVLDDGIKASDVVPFAQYLDLSLTKAHYHFGRGNQDMGEAGEFGYWMAIIQFVGFLLGGICIFGFLLSRPVCSKCNKYLRVLVKCVKQFSNIESLGLYYDEIFQHPVDSEEFANMVKSKCSVAKTEKGTLSLDTRLYECPDCKAQIIEDEVKVYNGSDWKVVNQLTRKVAIPDGINLISVFREK